ncbi:hypothetical protein Leryth_006467 [Lithospermum erythrorhizon]|nr:hypothetical protein Leryth_006467 [Lithospermum erythrorhizon]
MSQNTSDVEQEEQHCAHAMQLVTSVAVPFVLNAVIELQVFEILAKAGANVGLSAKEIASHQKIPLKFALVVEKDGMSDDYRQALHTKLIRFLKVAFHLIELMVPMGLIMPEMILGIEHVGGDMFMSVPQGCYFHRGFLAGKLISKSQLIYYMWILNDWSDENCIKLLNNCNKSLPNDGKVIVADHIYPINLDSSASVKYTSEFDVLMMTQAPGGEVRSEEFLALAKGGGFKGI